MPAGKARHGPRLIGISLRRFSRHRLQPVRLRRCLAARGRTRCAGDRWRA